MPAPAYAELAALYQSAQRLMESDSCSAAADSLEHLVAVDTELHFMAAYPLLEACYTKEARYQDARDLYCDAMHRAERHPDTTAQAFTEILDEWRYRYEIFLQTDQRIAARPEVYPEVVGGADGLRQGLVRPDTSQVRAYNGVVYVKAKVGEDGRVAHAYIQETSGRYAYDHAALSAIRQTPFEPARIGLRTIETWVLVPVEF